MKHCQKAIAGALLIIGSSIFTLTTTANAQSTACGNHTDVVKKLHQGYSERPVSMGLSNNGAVVEVFASKVGTFTIVITRPDGVACLVSVGEGWENISTRTAEVQS